MTFERRELKAVQGGGTVMAIITPMSKRSQAGEASAVVSPPEIDLLMRRFSEQSRSDIAKPAQPELPAIPVTSLRDFDTAAELLDRASKAFDLLVSRCQHMEGDLEQETERASAHAAGQDETIEKWKRLASGLKAQIETAEQANSALKQRYDAAEARATKAEQKATALERASTQAAEHAALAEQLSTKLHDKVVTAFGLGSRAYPVLEAVATQTAAE